MGTCNNNEFNIHSGHIVPRLVKIDKLLSLFFIKYLFREIVIYHTYLHTI